MGKGLCQTHRENPQRLPRNKEWPQSTHLLDCPLGDRLRMGHVLRLLWKSLAVLSLRSTKKSMHMGDLFSSYNSSTHPGGRAGSCFNTCCTSRETRCRGTPADHFKTGEVSSGHATSSSHSSCILEPKLACAAPPDQTEAPQPLPEELSLQPAFVPLRKEELLLESQSRAAVEPPVEPALPLSPIKRIFYHHSLIFLFLF